MLQRNISSPPLGSKSESSKKSATCRDNALLGDIFLKNIKLYLTSIVLQPRRKYSSENLESNTVMTI
jgi:hypothetical protein